MLKDLLLKLAENEISADEFQLLLKQLERRVADTFRNDRFEEEPYDLAMDVLTAFMTEGGFLDNFEEIHSDLSDDEFLAKFMERFDHRIKAKLDKLITQRDGDGFGGLCDRAQLPDDFDFENQSDDEDEDDY